MYFKNIFPYDNFLFSQSSLIVMASCVPNQHLSLQNDDILTYFTVFFYIQRLFLTNSGKIVSFLLNFCTHYYFFCELYSKEMNCES